MTKRRRMYCLLLDMSDLPWSKRTLGLESQEYTPSEGIRRRLHLPPEGRATKQREGLFLLRPALHSALLRMFF